MRCPHINDRGPMKICLNNELDVRYNLHHKWLVYQIKLISVWWWTKNPKSTYLIFFCISPIKTDKKKSKSFFFANRQEAPLFKGLSNGIDIYGSAPITMAYGLPKKISLPNNSRRKNFFFFYRKSTPRYVNNTNKQYWSRVYSVWTT